jgi:hypothetical protein
MVPLPPKGLNNITIQLSKYYVELAKVKYYTNVSSYWFNSFFVS